MSAEQKDELYAYTTTFNIQSEKDLDDFWSYFIFRLNLENNESTYDCFARLYNLLSVNRKLLSPLKHINISLKESSEKYILFIETTIDAMINKFIKRLEVLNFPYKHEENVLSYPIDKNSRKTIAAAEKVQAVKYKVYDFISQDDLNDMIACIEKVKDGNYNRIYVNEIADYQDTLSYYASILQPYPQLHIMNSNIAELSIILSLYAEECMSLGMDLKKLLQSFINNIWYWQESLFIKGGEELHFMDESLRADLSQIKMTLHLYDEVNEEKNECALDDIFDF